MKKLFSICQIGLTSITLLSGCQPSNDDTQKQIASLQEQLAKQQQKDEERAAREKEQALLQQQQAREEEIYRQAEEDFKNRQILEEEQKNLKQKEKNENQTAKKEVSAQNKKTAETLARYPAFVITESGYGSVNLRGAPSASSVSITQLNDGDQVQVVARTNACTTGGCWVKVRINGVTGYINEGYLQKGIAPQTNGSNDDGSGYPEDY
ncbi:SH3 domain-containing protein [Neisseria sp.]|uniref:SH3 domain-containing protein n=1 Tax=Neisseria sp. TaxID=192066 RepID=UPI0026DC0AA6|nr:SH3 domain-containing protein [Neisseria sp.]MDO4227751.1 SH3 domain-containing protein [Neisseria sp.]